MKGSENKWNFYVIIFSMAFFTALFAHPMIKKNQQLSARGRSDMNTC